MFMSLRNEFVSVQVHVFGMVLTLHCIDKNSTNLLKHWKSLEAFNCLRVYLIKQLLK